VDVTQRSAAVAAVAALAPGTPIAMIGGRRWRRGRIRGIATERICVAIPSLDEPVVVAEVEDRALRWFAGHVLTVPSGRSRGHGPMWAAVLIARRWPRLLIHAGVGDRIVIGVRR
jgi:hypothetical protein